MKTTQVAQYAFRLAYNIQPQSKDKMMNRSAMALAALGLGLSTFSVRQMIMTQSRRL